MELVLQWEVSGRHSCRTVSESNLKLIVEARYHHAFAVYSHLLVWERIACGKKKKNIQWNVNPSALGCIFPKASLNQMGCEVPFVSDGILAILSLSDGCI